jgi:plasmid stabilization system protein ParE
LKRNPNTGRSEYLVLWDDIAVTDFHEAYDYYFDHSPGAANRLREFVLEKSRGLSSENEQYGYDPDLGKPYRRILIWNFRLIYLVIHSQKKVLILKFWNVKRNPEKLKIK